MNGVSEDDIREAGDIDERLPKRWRPANVRKTDVYCHHADAIEGPNGERVLLRLNEHFPHEQDAQDIAAMRNLFPRLLSALSATMLEAARNGAQASAWKALAQALRREDQEGIMVARCSLKSIGIDPDAAGCAIREAGQVPAKYTTRDAGETGGQGEG